MKKIKSFLSNYDNNYTKGFIVGLFFPVSLLFYFIYLLGSWLYVTNIESSDKNE